MHHTHTHTLHIRLILVVVSRHSSWREHTYWHLSTSARVIIIHTNTQTSQWSHEQRRYDKYTNIHTQTHARANGLISYGDIIIMHTYIHTRHICYLQLQLFSNFFFFFLHSGTYTKRARPETSIDISASKRSLKHKRIQHIHANGNASFIYSSKHPV